MYPIQCTFCQDLVSRKALIFYKLSMQSNTQIENIQYSQGWRILIFENLETSISYFHELQLKVIKKQNKNKKTCSLLCPFYLKKKTTLF